jgi:hypothetical protein
MCAPRATVERRGAIVRLILRFTGMAMVVRDALSLTSTDACAWELPHYFFNTDFSGLFLAGTQFCVLYPSDTTGPAACPGCASLCHSKGVANHSKSHLSQIRVAQVCKVPAYESALLDARLPAGPALWWSAPDSGMLIASLQPERSTSSGLLTV